MPAHHARRRIRDDIWRLAGLRPSHFTGKTRDEQSVEFHRSNNANASCSLTSATSVVTASSYVDVRHKLAMSRGPYFIRPNEIHFDERRGRCNIN